MIQGSKTQTEVALSKLKLEHSNFYTIKARLWDIFIDLDSFYLKPTTIKLE